MVIVAVTEVNVVVKVTHEMHYDGSIEDKNPNIYDHVLVDVLNA